MIKRNGLVRQTCKPASTRNNNSVLTELPANDGECAGHVGMSHTLSFFEGLTSSDVLILILKAKLNLLNKSYLLIYLNKVE